MKKAGKMVKNGAKATLNVITGGRHSKNASTDVPAPSHTSSPFTSASHSSDGIHLSDETYEGREEEEEEEEEEESEEATLTQLIDEVVPEAAPRARRTKAGPSTSRLSTSRASEGQDEQSQTMRQLQPGEEQLAQWYNLDTTSGLKTYTLADDENSEDEDMELSMEDDSVLAKMEEERLKIMGKVPEGTSYGRGLRQRHISHKYPECLMRRIVATRYGSEKILDTLGIKEAVEESLKTVGLWHVLFTPQISYVQMTKEFFATLEKTRVRGKDALKFAILGHFYTLTSKDLNNIFAASPEKAKELDDGLLEKYSKYDYVLFWKQMTGRDGYYAGRVKTSALSNPLIRYTQKVLANTIVGRYDNQGTISQKEMFVLKAMTEKQHVNLGVLLIDHMKSIPYKSKTPFVMGGLVTSIALGLGHDLSGLEDGGPIDYVDMDYLIRSLTIKKDGNRLIYLTTSLSDLELELPYHAVPLLSVLGIYYKLRDKIAKWERDHPRETYVRGAAAAHEEMAESNVQGQEQPVEEQEQPRRRRRRDEGTSQLQQPSSNAYDMSHIQAQLEDLYQIQQQVQLTQQHMWQDQQQLHYQVNHMYHYNHAQAARNPEWGEDFWGGVAEYPAAYPPPQDTYWGQYYQNQHPPTGTVPPPDHPQGPDQSSQQH